MIKNHVPAFREVLGFTPLFVPSVTSQAWAERYGVEPFSVACGGCGAARTTTRAFAAGPYRGLMASQCPCGEPHPPYCVVAVRESAYDETARALLS